MHGFARIQPWTLLSAGETPRGHQPGVHARGQRVHAGVGVAASLPGDLSRDDRCLARAVARGPEHRRRRRPRSRKRCTATTRCSTSRRSRSPASSTPTTWTRPTGSSASHRAPPRSASTGETDRIYLATTATCTIDDPGMKRKIVVAKTGSNTTVVWNPWVDKAKAMPDFGDDEWPSMVCVETCNVGRRGGDAGPGRDAHDDGDDHGGLRRLPLPPAAVEALDAHRRRASSTGRLPRSRGPLERSGAGTIPASAARPAAAAPVRPLPRAS